MDAEEEAYLEAAAQYAHLFLHGSNLQSETSLRAQAAACSTLWQFLHRVGHEELTGRGTRSRKRVHRILRGDGELWRQMNETWPHLPGTMETELYYKYFRMGKVAYLELFSQVRGKITPEQLHM